MILCRGLVDLADDEQTDVIFSTKAWPTKAQSSARQIPQPEETRDRAFVDVCAASVRPAQPSRRLQGRLSHTPSVYPPPPFPALPCLLSMRSAPRANDERRASTRWWRPECPMLIFRNRRTNTVPLMQERQRTRPPMAMRAARPANCILTGVASRRLPWHISPIVSQIQCWAQYISEGGPSYLRLRSP